MHYLRKLETLKFRNFKPNNWQTLNIDLFTNLKTIEIYNSNVSFITNNLSKIKINMNNIKEIKTFKHDDNKYTLKCKTHNFNTILY